MTILQGTMQDGTVIPVQVDAQGRLVAEGLQGAAGPAGPQGPAGAGGVPDVATLPALPKPTLSDDLFLVQRNGVVYKLQAGHLVEGLKLAYVTDAIASVGTESGPIFSQGLGYYNGFTSPPTYAYDGDENTAAVTVYSNSVLGVYLPALAKVKASRIEIKTAGIRIRNTPSGGDAYPTNDGWWSLGNIWTGEFGGYLDCATAQGGHDGVQRLYGVKLDGVLLVDGASVTALNFASGHQLDRFTVGELIEGLDADGHPTGAVGTIAEIDATAHKMKLLLPQGAWAAGMRVRKLIEAGAELAL